MMHFGLGGISLSPAFAIMFVMQHFRLSWDDALQYVQNRRYCISPNGGFLTQLKVCLASSALYS
jgi:serine/threonine/tyrosine-interacting protein